MIGWALELTHPLRLLGLVAVPVLVYYFYRSLADFPRSQRLVSLAVRSVIVLLLVLSLAGLTLSRPTQEQFIVLAVDQSRSIGTEAEPALRKLVEEAAQKAGKNRIAFLPFQAAPGTFSNDPAPFLKKADEAASEKPAAEAPATPPAEAVPAVPPAPTGPPPGTDIEAAIEASLASIPPGYVPKILLLSDGNQTRGDALRTALQAKVPISTIPLPTRS